MGLLDETRKTDRAAQNTAPPSQPAAEGGAAQEPSKLDPLVLVFLDSPIARKLAIAWQTAKGNEDIWYSLAGISRSEAEDARNIGYALRENGICLDGGIVAPIALAYIRNIVVSPMTKGAGASPKRGRRRGR